MRCWQLAARDISIHALLAESDLIEDEALVKEMQISIHALLAESDTYFIEHLPDIVISIHALLAESDLNEITYFDLDNDFYPRSPCGERHLAFCLVACLQAISIHALLAESDRL